MRNLRNKIVSIMVVFTMLVAMVGVINVDSAYAATKKKIHLRKTTVTMYAGKTYQQKLIDKKGKTIKASKVKWKSLKKSVAKINSKGKITAVKKGTAKMTAKYKGKTYKFTVKVKAPIQNYKISVDKPSVTIMVGEKATLVVKTDNGEEIEFDDEEEDGISCEWGDWIDGTNDSYFYVSGVETGEYYINVFDSKDNDVSAEIKVKVVSGLEVLQEEINDSSSSFIDDDGYPTVAYTITDTTTVAFKDRGNQIDFIEYTKYPKADSICKTVMTMDVSDIFLGDVVVTTLIGDSNYIEMTSLVNAAKYEKGDTLAFYKSDGNMQSSDNTRKIANSEFQLAMNVWDIALDDLFGLSMYFMGFFNLD